MVRKHNIILLQSAQKGENRTKMLHLIGQEKRNNAGALIGWNILKNILKNRIAQNNLQISFKFFVVATAASS